MRRKDRQRDETFAMEMIDTCAYAVLSMVGPDKKAYAVPLSIVRDGESIYFHCAQEGYKIECLRSNPEVCLVCVGDVCPASDKFTTAFSSAIVKGTCEEIISTQEKTHALYLLCQRYTPQNMAAFDEAIVRSLARTAVYRITITEMTGKQKILS